jgi:hypothetical protein
MDDKKKAKNVGRNFPCGNVEEILRMMRKCREKGNVDCEIIMNEFMGKDFKRTDYERFKKQFFGETSKKRNL